MKILISPAKSISMEQDYPQIEHSIPHFLNESESLAKKLQKLSAKKLKALYKVSDDIAQLNKERFDSWESPAEKTANNKAAVYAFTGDVYRGLDIQSVDDSERAYLQNNLRILSGLYGMLRPMDHIYPYRLEMGTSFQVTPKTKNLYAFWGNKLTDFLNQEEKDTVLNLASNEYFKAIKPELLKCRLVTAQFKEFKNGEYKVLMTYAKQARGKMARFCADKKIEQIEDIKLFDYDGYQYMEQLSSEDEWVFVR
ncbi:MAG: peroxide stress protein YaaA [Bacteroidetes bacterium]|nr:MAG: peroxide stress protein YaaA [Bacteroidota bacterium]